ncbi:MAG TPA: efflux transporter outer membrane subunit [Terriglobales bacterium]
MRLTVLILLLASTLASAKGPKYQKPDVTMPQNWQAPAPWHDAAPGDSIPKGAWWTLFNDPELNQYEDRAMASNQTLKAAVARLSQARSFAQISASDLYPQVSGGVSAARQRISGNRPTLGAVTSPRPDTENTFQIPFNLNYEIDLFGRVRNSVLAANAAYQASAADLENVRLIVSAELAADFFQLRELDAEMAVVRKAIDFEQAGLKLVENRHTGGAASGLDVAQQQTFLDASIAQLSLLQQQHDQFEHALAALQGMPASNFVAPVRALSVEPPAVPLMLPSELLQRRPDIAEAERNVAQANARIGVARAALYPSISLSGAAGLLSRDIVKLVDAPSSFWSLGLAAVEPIINGGRNRAVLQNTRAIYDEDVANYRESSLVAFQQVEDALSGLNALSAAYSAQIRAVDDARRALTLANARYTGGLVTYLDVITAQETLLSNERLSTQILGQRLTTSVLLVKALGGGWDSASLASVGIKPSLKQAVQQ